MQDDLVIFKEKKTSSVTNLTLKWKLVVYFLQYMQDTDSCLEI